MPHDPPRRQGASQQDTYSAMFEIVGIRDLAVTHSDEFERLTNEFRSCLVAKLASDTSTYVCVFLDKCILRSPAIEPLCKILSELRGHLMAHSTLSAAFRAVIAKLDCNLTLFSNLPGQGEWRDYSLTQGYNFDSYACQLYGYLEQFKGVGIRVISIESQKLRSIGFENYTVPWMARQHYASFFDIAFEESELTTLCQKNLFTLARKSMHNSTRGARFFVPALINCIQHMDLSGIVAGADSLPELLCNDVTLREFKKVAGMELVYLKLFSRLCAEPPDEGTDSYPLRIKLNDYLFRSKWIRTLLQPSEQNPVPPPEALISRRFISDFTNRLIDIK